MLTCSCPDIEDDMWSYIEPDDFTILSTVKRKRCKSCNKLINIGDTSLRFNRLRYPKNDIEERIYGEGNEIDLAPYYMCEKCGDQYFNLSALGFCIDITEYMFNLLKEYREIYGRKPTIKKGELWR